MREKGSKTAMIKLVKSEDYINIINGLIKENEVIITSEDISIPNAQIPNKEVTLSSFLRQNFDPKKAKNITDWWIQKGNATPKWDLISTCTIDGKRGILLVEAKAHKGELKNDKKKEGNQDNFKQIVTAIAEANTTIKKEVNGICLSTENCYQFSNRVAHAWWLANQGIPVVLLYLGFLNVDDLNVGDLNVGDLNEDNKKYNYKLFTSHDVWKGYFEEHTKIVDASELIDKSVDCGEGSFVTICRSY